MMARTLVITATPVRRSACCPDTAAMVDLSKTLVIKIGTSSLIREDVRKLNISCLAQICEIVSKMRAAGMLQ